MKMNWAHPEAFYGYTLKEYLYYIQDWRAYFRSGGCE